MVALAGLMMFLVIPIIYIYSFIKPEKFNIRTGKNPDGKYSRLKFTGLTVLLWFLFAIIGGIFSDPLPTEEKKNTEVEIVEPEPEEVVEPEPEEVNIQQDKTFGITPDEYGKRFVAEAKEVGLGDYKWSKVDLEKGEINDTFKTQLSDAVGTVGVVDKNGEVKSITYIMGRTDDGDTEGMNMIMMAGLTARALSPELPKEQTAGKLVELATTAIESYDGENSVSKSKVVDDIEYSVTLNNFTGFWITFSPKE